MRKKSILLLSLLFIAGCEGVTQSSTPPHSSIKESITESSEIPQEQICQICNYAEKQIYDDLAQFTPTKFDSTTVNKTTTLLAKGVTQSKYTFTLTNGNNSMVVATEVDLNYASIVAGTYENQTSAIQVSKIYNHLQYYEAANPTKKVLLATNADFFGGNTAVNAFVKDSIIIKNSHNDKGIYDYTNLNADIPASMPMLFGVSSTTAQIAPIVKNQTVENTIKSKLFYTLESIRNNESKQISNNVVVNQSNEKQNINIVFNTSLSAAVRVESYVLKLKKDEHESTRVHGQITEITEVSSYTTFKPTNDEYYIIVPKSLGISDFTVGDILTYYINSEDGTWKYYDTIIGCRQSLVENGNIASTVTKENSNGAQTTGVPRTAIGVMPNGNVVIFNVEGLRYSKKSTDESDPYGLNLIQLAEFMRYYGVYNGANFDGGGSTSLITRNPQTDQLEVTVRSSDYATTNLNDSRNVINSLLVTTKR